MTKAGERAIELSALTSETAIGKAREILVGISGLTSEAAVAGIQQIQVTNDAEQAFAAQLLQEIKTQWHALEEQRTAITGPLNKAQRAVNDLFRPASRALEHEEAYLKLKLTDYMELKEKANTAALQAAAVAPTPEAAALVIQTVVPVAPPAGVSVRKVWKFEVTDAGLVPREFCSPDAQKIEAAFHAGVTEIPGVRFYQEPIVTARRGR